MNMLAEWTDEMTIHNVKQIKCVRIFFLVRGIGLRSSLDIDTKRHRCT